MDWTRRAFLCAAGTIAATPLLVARSSRRPALEALAFAIDDPCCLSGDPYLATADGPGLGGRSFSAARARALRLRLPAAERDRLLLGLEDDRA